MPSPLPVQVVLRAREAVARYYDGFMDADDGNEDSANNQAGGLAFMSWLGMMGRQRLVLRRRLNAIASMGISLKPQVCYCVCNMMTRLRHDG